MDRSIHRQTDRQTDGRTDGRTDRQTWQIEILFYACHKWYPSVGIHVHLNIMKIEVIRKSCRRQSAVIWNGLKWHVSQHIISLRLSRISQLPDQEVPSFRSAVRVAAEAGRAYSTPQVASVKCGVESTTLDVPQCLERCSGESWLQQSPRAHFSSQVGSQSPLHSAKCCCCSRPIPIQDCVILGLPSFFGLLFRPSFPTTFNLGPWPQVAIQFRHGLVALALAHTMHSAFYTEHNIKQTCMWTQGYQSRCCGMITLACLQQHRRKANCGTIKIHKVPRHTLWHAACDKLHVTCHENRLLSDFSNSFDCVEMQAPQRTLWRRASPAAILCEDSASKRITVSSGFCLRREMRPKSSPHDNSSWKGLWQQSSKRKNELCCVSCLARLVSVHKKICPF